MKTYNVIIKAVINTLNKGGEYMPNITAEELERLKKSEEKLKERYKKQNEHTNTIYDRLNFTVPAGKKADVEAAAKAVGVSLNAFCREAVLEAVGNVLQNQQTAEDMPPFM